MEQEDAFVMNTVEAYQEFVNDYKDYIYYDNINDATILALSDSGYPF